MKNLINAAAFIRGNTVRLAFTSDGVGIGIVVGVI